ncbi:MAG: hypothetical protein ACTSQB_04555 [Candidatus Heimdallarchaeota archaeon]
MQFKKNTLGYLKLGLIFTIFGIIPTAIITMVGGPLVLGGLMVGGLTGMGITFVLLILIAFLVQGWFVYWFYSSNKFKRG